MGRHRTPKVQTLSSCGLWLLCLVLGSAEGSQSQQSPPSSSEGTAAAFIGYATNRSFVFPDIATSPGRLSTAGKFKLFVNQSISPPYIFVAAPGAALDQARNVPEGYGQGWGAYGSRFGASMARASSSSFFGSFYSPPGSNRIPAFSLRASLPSGAA